VDGLIDEVVVKTVEFSGADLALLRQAAKLHALQRGGFAAEMALAEGDFDAALADFATHHSTLV
jgi:SpoVK/Ycf46/Vps4 family AAA+-type ATPase